MKCSICVLESKDFNNCKFGISCPNHNKKKRSPGGGRKLKYNEPVKLTSFKCPESKVKEFRKSVNIILKSYLPPTNKDI